MRARRAGRKPVLAGPIVLPPHRDFLKHGTAPVSTKPTARCAAALRRLIDSANLYRWPTLLGGVSRRGTQANGGAVLPTIDSGSLSQCLRRPSRTSQETGIPRTARTALPIRPGRGASFPHALHGWRHGLSTIEVLTNETNAFSAEPGLVQAWLNELLALVQLYQSRK
jgi:hypothetical protein